MSKLTDIFASLLTPDVTPSAPKTRLIEQTSITPRNTTKGPINMSRMTKETLRQIIDNVETDPLAGYGSLTKKDILIDRLLAHWNTVERPTVSEVKSAPTSIMAEPKGNNEPKTIKINA